MPGGGGAGTGETTQTVSSVPYLSGDTTYAAGQARDLYDRLRGGNKTREDFYNQLKGDYTTTTQSGYDVGNALYRAPDGSIVTGRDAHVLGMNKGIHGSQGLYEGALEHYGAQGYNDWLQDSGYQPVGEYDFIGSSEVDYDGLNSAVDEAYKQQAADKYQYYPDSTVVGFSGATEDALSGIEARARAGSGLNRSANTLTQDTLDGKYLNSNPYLDDVVNYATQDITDRYLNEIMPSVNSTFAKSGRYGSGAQASAVGNVASEYLDSVGKTSSGIRYQNYNDERGRQGAYAALAPALAQNDYADFERLAGVGGAREGMDRAYLQEDIDRYNFNRDSQSMLLDDYISRVTALNGGYGTQTSTSSRPQAGGSTAGGILSGGAAGLGIGSMLAGTSLGSSSALGGVVGAAGPVAPFLPSLGGPVGIGLGVGGALLGGLFS